MELINILTIILLIFIFIALILAGIYFIMVFRSKNKKEELEQKPKEEDNNTYNGLTRESIYSFMEFDEIKAVSYTHLRAHCKKKCATVCYGNSVSRCKL